MLQFLFLAQVVTFTVLLYALSKVLFISSQSRQNYVLLALLVSALERSLRANRPQSPLSPLSTGVLSRVPVEQILELILELIRRGVIKLSVESPQEKEDGTDPD